MSEETQQQRTRKEIQRVDSVLQRCEQRGLDPLVILEREVQSNQRRPSNGGNVSAMRRGGLEQ